MCFLISSTTHSDSIPLSLHDALPIAVLDALAHLAPARRRREILRALLIAVRSSSVAAGGAACRRARPALARGRAPRPHFRAGGDRGAARGLAVVLLGPRHRRRVSGAGAAHAGARAVAALEYRTERYPVRLGALLADLHDGRSPSRHPLPQHLAPHGQLRPRALAGHLRSGAAPRAARRRCHARGPRAAQAGLARRYVPRGHPSLGPDSALGLS